MKYFKALLRGSDEIFLSEVEANRIGELMLTGENNQVIKIDDTVLRVGDIRRIERDYEAEQRERDNDLRRQSFDQPLIGASKQTTCQGQYSIQREVNNVIKTQYPDDWAKRIQSPEFREAVRQKLLTVTGEWCDYKTNVCMCENRVPTFA